MLKGSRRKRRRNNIIILFFREKKHDFVFYAERSSGFNGDFLIGCVVQGRYSFFDCLILPTKVEEKEEEEREKEGEEGG